MKKKETGVIKFFKGIVGFFRDDKFRVSFASFLVLLSIYLFIAFISYFFTWKADQDFMWESVFSGPDVKVQNHAGKLGAWISCIFLDYWFGVSSLGFPFLVLVSGLALFGLKYFQLIKTTQITLVGIILTSVLLGFIFGDFSTFLGSGPGGSHGYHISRWLNASLGKTGTFFLLMVLIMAYLSYSFAGFLPMLKSLSKGKPKSDSEIEPATEHEMVKMTIDNNVAAFKEDIYGKDDFPDPELISNPLQPENKEPVVLDEDIEMIIAKQDEGDLLDDFELAGIEGDYDPTLDLSSYKYPPLSLLKDHESSNNTVSTDELVSNKKKIVETLANYKITITRINATIGPTVTLYEIVPAPGIRISKIKSLEDDIALSLSALGIRIIAPIPGRGTIGIEVPNQQPKTVSMKNVLSSRKFQENDFELPVALGKTISNETYVFDFAKMPHLLVAGATGQGKSVGLNAVISSLLYKKHPSQLKFVLVDPKKVELTLFSKIERHFLAKLPDTEEAIITDTHKVIATLKSLTMEMDERYNLLKAAHVRNIREYNDKFIKRKLNPEKGHRFLPYIILVIDEFADLIMTAGREVEMPLARLAQLARAIGIHLLIATQRPTTNIITGVIKANFPARIAFRVMSVIDSRTILDMSGANQLIGRGDMLISAGSEPIRLQCAFIDTDEIEALTSYIGEQRGYAQAHLLPEVEEMMGESIEVDLKKRDLKFEEAARLVVQFQQGSTSLIQRKLSLGYNRAGRIVDQLEAAGILGSFEGSKARDVLIKDELSLEHILRGLE
jgi:DNA segregation ATPase FtsK/SpoIIIE, S-DNA-T family